jgi:vesicle coat complex subunit
MENVYTAVEGGLRDAHPYVREAAVMGVLKCCHQDEAGASLRALPAAVLDMLKADTDPQVVANCLYVLQQLGRLSGVITRPFVVSLLNHIRAFSDWAQCLVLEVLWRHYRPATEEERFDMLELLDFGLNHANSAVVMATAKLFLHYTANYPEQYAQVLESIKGPLQTLIQGREPEVVYAVLCNVLVLAQRHPDAFTQLSADCFCRPEDPAYLKALKIDALVATAVPGNAYDAAEEASQYARDRDTDVA